MGKELGDLYEATAEDTLFGIGELWQGDAPAVPYICIHCPDWTREKLEIVREAFQEGLDLSITRRGPGLCDLYIATREMVTVQLEQGDQASVLRGPAWDARLDNVDERVIKRFEAQRRRRGGFMLLVQGGDEEFLTRVDEREGRAQSSGTPSSKTHCW